MIEALSAKNTIDNQHTVLVVSPMGTRKTTMVSDLSRKDGSHLCDIMSVINPENEMSSEEKRVIAILPRSLITIFTSEQVGDEKLLHHHQQQRTHCEYYQS